MAGHQRASTEMNAIMRVMEGCFDAETRLAPIPRPSITTMIYK